MKIVLVIFLLLVFVSSSFTQDVEQLPIVNLKGLATAKNDFQIQPNELTIAHNINLSSGGIGGWKKRLGFDSLFQFPGADSIIALEAINYLDGTEQLIAVVDSEGVGYANIYVSDLNTTDFASGSNILDSFNLYVQRGRWIDDFCGVQSTFPSGIMDSIIVYDTIIIENTADTFAVVDTVNSCSADSIAVLNDTLVARINANPLIATHVTAGVINDTSYYIIGNSPVAEVSIRLNFKNYNDGTYIPNPFGGDPFVAQTIDFFPSGTPSNKVATEWSVQQPTYMTQYRDRMYITNGAQKALVYNGDVVKNWPPNAPGEVSLVPLDVSGDLNGEYRYTFKYLTNLDVSGSSFTLDSVNIGYISTPVKVLNGRILVKDFIYSAEDTATIDSIFLSTFRTRANPGSLDEADTAFFVRTDTFTTVASLLNFSFIDSISDTIIDTSGAPQTPLVEYLFADQKKRYGKLQLESIDTSIVSTDSGVYNGSDENTLGVSYIFTYLDTLSLIESDSAYSLNIFKVDDSDAYYNIRVPISSISGSRVNIYRADIRGVETTIDAFGNDTVYLDISGFGGTGREEVLIGAKYQKSAIDTTINRYVFLKQLDDTVTVFSDSVGMDILFGRAETFELTTPPSGMTQMFTYDNRLFGIKNSQIYNSRIGDVDQWEVFDIVQMDIDDGDQINIAYPFRGGIFAAKNYRAYNLLFPYNNSEWEITGVPGCIAPRSHVKANGVDYYLSDLGVVSLLEGSNLIRHHEVGLLSEDIDFFVNKDIEELRNCYAHYVPQTQQVWFTVGDTTAVWDIRAQGWTTYGIPVGGSALFDVDSIVRFVPGRTTFFYQPNGKSIYRFGQSDTDDGVPVSITVATGPILQDAALNKIRAVSVWSKTDPDDTSGTQIGINFFNEEDELLDPGGFLAIPLNKRLSTKDFTQKDAVYYRLIFASNPTFFPILKTTIDRIDIYYETIQESPTFK